MNAWQVLKQRISFFRQFVTLSRLRPYIQKSHTRLSYTMHLVPVNAAHQRILYQMFRLRIHVSTKIQSQYPNIVKRWNHRCQRRTFNTLHPANYEESRSH
ncbi:hypothetical protein D3C78_1727920 [compost metagenome]